MGSHGRRIARGARAEDTKVNVQSLVLRGQNEYRFLGGPATMEPSPMALLRSSWPLLLSVLLAACPMESPPEAPPPSSCGPEMAELSGKEGTVLCVDLAPVTVAAYEECVGRALCSARPVGKGCLRDDISTQQRPVNCVDKAQADAFCKSQRKRLLTRDELSLLPLDDRRATWPSLAEWTSTPAQPHHTFALRLVRDAPPSFLLEVFPSSTQDAALGFRCGR
ncbi:MAG: hypothetical protein RMJ98_22770 [Myxococcales bacterium]|nr:hypothetical protein [Polyangiaceae bacterium]MDW8252129.1 hypothetical protein [Myxococcales bacterium]